MKAIICTKYGPPEVLQWVETEQPVPKDNEILIRVKATAVNSGDCRIRRADPFLVRLVFGFSKPRKPILGTTLAGIVESVGEKVTRFKPGDEVFGSAEMQMGAHAEYVCVSEKSALASMPPQWSFQQAAAIPFGAHTALSFLRLANIKPGHKVMIYGASGAVGTAAVQLAKYFGAEVTAVCSNASTTLVKGLGADRVLDYTLNDFNAVTEEWDVIFETVNKIPVRKIARRVKKGGTLILGAAIIKEMLQGQWISMTRKCKVLMGTHAPTPDDMNALKQLMIAGELKPVIDRIYPLENTAEAHRYVDTGRKKGNVVIVVDHAS